MFVPMFLYYNQTIIYATLLFYADVIAGHLTVRQTIPSARRNLLTHPEYHPDKFLGVIRYIPCFANQKS